LAEQRFLHKQRARQVNGVVAAQFVKAGQRHRADDDRLIHVNQPILAARIALHVAQQVVANVGGQSALPGFHRQRRCDFNQPNVRERNDVAGAGEQAVRTQSLPVSLTYRLTSALLSA
jgi:hypothetical protein